MKNRLAVSSVLLVLALASSVVHAEGLYVGAGLGNTFFSSSFDFEDVTEQTKKIDENSTAWKIFGGFSGQGFLGVEGGYRHFGTVKSDFGDGEIESKIKGWDVEALGRITVAIVDLFAKAGVMFWDSEVSYGDASADDSGTNFLWGLGAGVHLGPIGVRLEWESLEQKDVDNLSVVSLGATYGF